jgi:hypothetical protein
MELGLSTQEALKLATSSKGWWRLSQTPNINIAMSNEWFKNLGLVNLETKVLEFRNLIKTAVCDNARTVV